MTARPSLRIGCVLAVAALWAAPRLPSRPSSSGPVNLTERVDSLVVRWPSGREKVHTDLEARRTWTVVEGEVASPVSILPRPGGAPRLLGPGVVSTDTTDDLHPTFTPDGDTLHFVRRVPDGRFTIMVTHRIGSDGWSEPRVASFSGRWSDQEPFVSPDGRRLYFTSDRPLAGDEPIEGRETWFVERNGSGWGTPRRLEAPHRVPRSSAPTGVEVGRFWGQPWGPTVGPDGALYFWAERPGGLGHTDLYRAPPGGGPGGFGEPENVGAPINTEHYETGGALSPDGTTLVFGRDDPEGFGLGDLFVSCLTDDGWSEPVNLGAGINTAQFDFAPRFSPDGRRLYFSSNRHPDGEGRGPQNIYVLEWRP